ncbi:hypothetical protein F1880_006146 [Penicillium rolfsii]|nr:hypothetical protein F1880_006146 [Penicillium rolfsii]
MTTTSSSTFATMEVPAVEDSMEMASPYHGGADDFDIDIDLMEDQVSNMDSDMMGADDYPNTSQVSLFGTEANDDADMADEPSEGSIVDTDLVDEDPDIEVQYEETTYEAEMLEGDQADEPVAPVPSIHIEVQPENSEHGDSTTGLPTVIDKVQHQPATHDGPETAPSETALVESDSAVNETQGPQTHDEEPPLVSHEDQKEQLGQTEGNNNAESLPNQPDVESQDNNGTIESKPAAAEEPVDTSVQIPEKMNPEEEARSTVDEIGDGQVEHLEANVSHETEGHDTHEGDESLHPVKVLYQEAEISLFPPMEGDSAETFFLHDEDIAYDNFGKLFSSLREVLLDNVAENEVLVVDIDSLGIQITEDSSHTSDMTLHQILNIYLRLCHNDGNDEPEALYLTLSSRPNVQSELANLEAAANEGKGLSQVHPWSEFEDGDDSEDPQAVEHPVEDSTGDQDRQELSLHETEECNQEQVVPGSAAEFEAHDAVNKDAPTEAISDSVSGEHNAEAEPEIEATEIGATETQQADETDQADASRYADENSHDWAEEHYEEQYDSEAPKTESTSTVVPASDHVEKQELTEAVSAEAFEDALDDKDGQDRTKGDGKKLNDEDSSEQHKQDGFEGKQHEEYQDELAEDETYISRPDDETHPVDFAPAHDEGALNDLDSVAAVQDASVGVLDDEIDDHSVDQSESTVDNLPKKESATHEEPEDDLLGIAEDLLEGPASDHVDDLNHIKNTGFEQEPEDVYPEATVGDAVAADDDLVDDDSGNYEEEDSYQVLEFSEHVESGEADIVNTDSQTHENPSKRSREEEDEWDFEETSTPELKRRRPS